MTVAELIAELEKVPDKSWPVNVSVDCDSEDDPDPGKRVFACECRGINDVGPHAGEAMLLFDLDHFNWVNTEGG